MRLHLRYFLLCCTLATVGTPGSTALANPAPGLITDWTLSPVTRLSAIDVERYPAHALLDRSGWKEVKADANGRVDIAQHRTAPADGSPRVLARTTLRAEQPGSRAFGFEHRGEILVYLNGQPVFRASHGSPATAPADAGLTLNSTAWLPLHPGDNELLVVITRGADGWTVGGRDLDAVYQHPSLTRVWELTTGIDGPESVAYDQTHQVLYASNYLGGSIARIGLDGKVLTPEVATGLRRPTGVKVFGDRLYVVDRSGLVQIDPATGQVVSRVTIEGAAFPNDVALSPDGTAYVSDSPRNRLYRVSGGKAELWLEDAALAQSNAMAFVDGKLFVGVSSDGAVRKIDPVTKRLEPFATFGAGVIMDGLAPDGRGGWIVSDYFGHVYQVNAAGKPTLLLDRSGPRQFCADLEYIPEKQLLIIPSLFDRRITAYRLEFSTPEHLRDAHLRWRGGDAFRRMSARHFRGDLQVSTLSGQFECWEDTAGAYRYDVHAGPINITTRVRGQTGFYLTPGGQVEALSPEDCTRKFQAMLPSYVAALEGAGGAVISPLPATGPDQRGLRISFPNGDWCDFVVRPDGELLSTREHVDGVDMLTTYADWRFVDGVRLPFVIESVSQADGQRTVMKLSACEVNPKLDAALYAKPEVASRLRFDAGARDSGKIGFELFAGTRLFVPGAVNGRQTTLLLDSGAEVTVVDAAFAREAGIQPSGRIDVRGTAGTENTGMASDVAITLGTLTLRTGMVVIMDLSPIAKMIDHPLRAILGKEVLNQTVTELDFEARTILFHDPSAYTASPEMTRVPLVVAGGNRAVAARVEGHETVNMDFDLGNGGALLVFPQSATKWQLLANRPTGERLGGGVGGLRRDKAYTVRTLEIGGYTLREVPARTPVDAEKVAYVASETVQGNIGLPVWSRFHLVLDFGRNQMFIRARPETLARPFVKNRSGMTLVREGDAFKVLLVDPGFPGPVCATGAEIVAVDGTPVARLRSVDAWAERPAGTVATLTFRDGKKAQLTLADTY